MGGLTVLVTGGAGFVGSHICDELIRQGHTAQTLDSLVSKVDFTPTLVKERSGRDLYNVTSGELFGVDVVVHAAARADISANWESAKERERLWRDNVRATAALLEASRGRHVIFLSTCAVYGDSPRTAEDDATFATSPYAASKIAGEALVQAYSHKEGTPHHVLRLSCCFGARYHHGHVRDFVDECRMGPFVARSDGTVKRSAVHVKDVAEAVALCASGSVSSGTYNVGTGTWCPRDTARLMGASAEISWPEKKPKGWVGDPAPIVTSQKLRNAGWHPKHSVETGAREALAHLGWRS